MKKIFIFILNIVISFQTLALTPYEAKYNLSAKTELGNFKIGTAKYRLLIDENGVFAFTSEAYTDPIWVSLYDYSWYEKSIGLKINNQLTSIYYDLVKIQKGKENQNYQFKVYPENNYAIISDLENNDERLEIENNPILDSLSVYLALAEDITANPDQVEFIYQVAGKHGVEEQKFRFIGHEDITINGKNVNTIKVSEPEGRLFYLAKDYNFVPAIIIKTDNDREIRLTLTKFNELK